ncbi:MAG: SCO family protein [Melioribacteraceae bacterium]
MRLELNKKTNLITTIFILIFVQMVLFSQNKQIEIGIDEKLGNFLPLDLEFRNSNNDKIKLDDVINKPILLALVYYECPGICNSTLTELAWVIDRVDLVPGEDFEVVTISIDHDETPAVAKKSKNNYFASLQRDFPKESWNFLTGDSLTISKLSNSVGYYFKKYEEEFRHPGGLITISPKGKISRYLFGTQFNQFDVKMALLDAEAGKTNPTIAKVLKLCFSYNAADNSYRLSATRIIGGIMLISILSYLVFLLMKKRKVVKA